MPGTRAGAAYRHPGQPERHASRRAALMGAIRNEAVPGFFRVVPNRLTDWRQRGLVKPNVRLASGLSQHP